jgi:predicted metal-binding membrane protein
MHEGLGALAAMWAAMMALMMAPAAAPSWIVHARMSRSIAASSAYLAGYLGAWAAAGVAYAGTHWLLQEAGFLDGDMRLASARAGGVLLMAAGAWQWTAAKAACVARCRSPLGFMLSDWRDGSAGALAMGMRYAAWCLGCCWLAMAVLFVAGAMSIPWAIAISAYVLLERLLPLPRAFDRAAGAAIAALGLWRIVFAA